MKREYYEKVCELCGAEFIARHGNKRMCPECYEVTNRGKNRHLPRRYACPEDIEQYEARVRQQNIADYKDTIVAIGYADRQREDPADGRKGQGGTVTFKIIALIVITILLVLDYALLVIAHDADERAERMYKEWKDDVEANKGRTDRTCGDEVVE